MLTVRRRDILHPNRANISKDELREKLGGLYKAQKDQISVFGLRTQFGGGKTSGFALVYDSPEAMKKFEPKYRLIRVGLATKTERPSRQQRTCPPAPRRKTFDDCGRDANTPCRQAEEEPPEDAARHSKGQGCQGEEGQISASPTVYPGSGCFWGRREGWIGSALWFSWCWKMAPRFSRCGRRLLLGHVTI